MRVARILAPLLTAALSVTVLCSSSEAAPEPVGAQAQTFSPPLLSKTIDVPNSQRGQYRWLGAEPRPATAAANDVYYRDQIYWGRIEPQDNQWDFSYIEAGLADARARGGKFSFRVMSYCPNCWMTFREDFPSVTPSFVEKQPNIDVPAWNSSSFLTQWESLMAELGRRYARDPALGTIDVGGYGAYGEWHVFEGEGISDANGQRVIRAVTKAFPNNWVLLNSMTPVPFFKKALDANPNLGMRTDSLGCENMYSMVAVSEELQSYWKTRPFHTEWCTRADPKLGADQVKLFHISTMSSSNMPWTYESLTPAEQRSYSQALRTAGYRYALRSVALTPKVGRKYRARFVVENQGTAPVYDSWVTELVLTGKDGKSRAVNVRLNLKKILPGRVSLTRTVKLRGLSRGKYSMAFRVRDPESYLTPMNLANQGRDSNGAYRIGTLRVR